MPVMTTWNRELYIDGEWTSEGTDGVIEVINPATEEVIGSVPQGDAKVAQRAIEAARRAFDEGPWPWMKPAERAAKLIKMAEVLEARAPELRELIIAETGSTGFLADAIQGLGSVGMYRSNANLVEHNFPWAEVEPPSGGPNAMGGSGVFREPVGVVGAITAFNFPFMLNTVKVAPALAVGCTVVLKPHPWTPLDAALIADAAAEADIPPGVFNVISGGADVGEELSTNPMVDMVTFTGSTATGKAIMRAASTTMKKVQLELGGKSAHIMLGDVTEDHARSFGFGMVIVHCGQGCAIPTRLLLPEHLLPAYLEGVEAMRSFITIGDPADESNFLGPLIREQQRTRVEELVQSGLDEGAELVAGGKRPDGLDKGFFYEPTVLIGRNDMRIAQEEIFGPVLTVIPYSGEDADAVRIANDSIYGLAGNVVSASSARAFNVGRRIRAGAVQTNGLDNPLADQGPGTGQGPDWGASPKGIGQTHAFGGYKQSGIGREWGRHGLEDFTEVKSLHWS
jgi:acyl-CoA reductase-like NAD-dependent aldehyde dehydrogenase